MAYNLIEAVQTRWRAVNAPHLVALVRSGAVFHKGKLLERPVDITPTETDKSPETEVATPTDGQPEARAHGGHRRPHVRAALGGELDQPGGQSTRRRPGCDALHDPGEHEREDPAGRPEDRRPGRGQQKGRDQHRTAPEVVTQRSDRQQGTDQSGHVYGEDHCQDRH